MNHGLTSFQRAIAIAESDNFLGEFGFKEMLNGIASMKKSFDGAMGAIATLMPAFDSWPSSIPELEMGKQKLIALHKDLQLFFERASRTLTSIQGNLEG